MTPSLHATLHHLQLCSPQPERLAGFYRDTLAMEVTRDGERWLCQAPDRCLIIVPGEARTLAAAGYRVDTTEMLDELASSLAHQGVVRQSCETGLFRDGAVAFADPDGNRLVFGIPQVVAPASPELAARLQHVVVGSSAPAVMAEFYSDVIGFKVSDRVLDGDRALRTAFLRSDEEHHSFAVFQTEQRRFDHHCYELPDWNAIRDWGDRLAARQVAVEWGPGRHGPGNNLFLFFHDPDGNWLELSAELEKVPDDRPAGEWPHAERTLNLWGRGLLRS